MANLDHPVSKIEQNLRAEGKRFVSAGEDCFVKAVTFGPFPAGAFPDEGRTQLPLIRERLGANALRLYEIPSVEFMHACAGAGLRVFLGLPWSQHVDFRRDASILAEAEERLAETISLFRGHPALAGYFVANEIETTLVRWMGRRHVLELLERLIDFGHAHDPEALFAYANYPSTEYLLPANQDFVAFNLYLEDRADFASYLARLQNLAGDKPLLISEFGADSRTHGEIPQAEILEWHLEEACRAGLAGTTVFSWSDLWQRGGAVIEDYDFGLTRRDGSARPALEVLREAWLPIQRASDVIDLTAPPRISVIVCTHRGSATLVPCLDSLVRLDYPDYEIVVVNDGSDPRVSEIAATYPEVRRFDTEHLGLSAARNFGAAKASGDVLAYTDDDCIADKDWLRWIARQFAADPTLGGAGGPNIPPPAESLGEARIAAAPGGASHVLLTDTRAEHLPGCNFAVTREAFERIGGFNPVFRSAGDDVDFCWRLLEAGYGLGFHAAAFVWHRRRSSLRAYLRQQSGYGKAEALLLPLHRARFKGLGGAVWKGQVYEPLLPGRSIVYHGRYGYEPFQLIYPDPEAGMGEVALHALWWFVALLGIAASPWIPWIALGSLLMLCGSARIAWRRAKRAPLAREHESLSSRLFVAALVLLQGIVRSGSRLRWGWREAKWSRSAEVLSTATWRRVSSGWWKLGHESAYWSGEGVGRDALLEQLLQSSPSVSIDESGRTDLILKRGWLWNWALLTATEYHENEGRLTRTRLLARPTRITRMLVLPALVAIPAAVALGWGFRSELLTLGAIYLGGIVAARLFVMTKRPLVSRAAKALGLAPM